MTMPDDFVNPMDAIGDAAGAAFGDAMANGATPEQAMEAAGNAAQGAAEGLGVPMDMFQPVMGSAMEAFGDAMAVSGKSTNDAWMWKKKSDELKSIGDSCNIIGGPKVLILGLFKIRGPENHCFSLFEIRVSLEKS